MSAVGPVASVLLASSEVVGFAKTGGLADVCGSLPPALARRGHRCAVIMPLYRSAKRAEPSPEPTEHVLRVSFAGCTVPARLWRSVLPKSEVPIYFVEQPDYYERDNPETGAGIYIRKRRDGEIEDYPDNVDRFGFFSRAVLEAVPHLGFTPDLIHANDWQTGLVPVYLKELYRHEPGYLRIRSLMTIHNLAFQGVFPAENLPRLGLGWHLFNMDQLEFYGQINLLKAGIVFADRVTTVSPTYAREIQTSYFGCGLQNVLRQRGQRLSGIVNGIDTEVWNPETDTHLAEHYRADTVAEGKRNCKAALQEELGLALDPGVPLLGVVARLAEQKGIDLILGAIEPLLEEPAQIVILGTGAKHYLDRLDDLHQRYPKRFAFVTGLNEPLAHRIEAGCDLFLMPSLYEPCGLNQLYSLRYGTPPVVRATGGLSDTVTDATDDALLAGKATGFSFISPSPQALLETARRAIAMFRSQPDKFRQLIRTGMAQDWSWDRSAADYEDLYLRLIGERDARIITSHRGRPRE